jgi:8-oxo-dGTP pyrophosphatase MutT (NUDIX family)
LQKRADNGFWGLPAGSMELGESFEACARREVMEETGLVMDKMELFATESGSETHYVYPNGDEVDVAAVYYICREYHGELKIQEDEVTEQRFFAIDEIPPEDKLDPVNKPVIDLAMSELS